MNTISPRDAEAISSDRVQAALSAAGLPELSPSQREKLADYGNLLMRWNSRMNLTAIRDAEGILHRHIVESVAAALVLPSSVTALLDYGSGAGLPGIPIAAVRSEIRVTLAESQSKKAAFLREAVRSLGLTAEVYAGRVESMAAGQTYDAVTLRAVERMPSAASEARKRVRPDGLLVLFATEVTERELLTAAGMASMKRVALPTIGFLLLCSK